MKIKFLIGLPCLLLFSLTVPVIAWECDPPCEGCRSCEAGVCVDDPDLCIPCQNCEDGECVDDDDDDLCFGCERCSSSYCIDDDTKCPPGGPPGECYDCDDGTCYDDDSKCDAENCEECVGGTCVSSCPSGECCDDGTCVSSCPSGECCDDGTCVSSCPSGKCCSDGMCVDTCPSGQCCDETEATCVKKCEDNAATCEWDMPDDYLVNCENFDPTDKSCEDIVLGQICSHRIVYRVGTAKCADCEPDCAKNRVEACAEIYPIRCMNKRVLLFLYCVCQDEDELPRHSGDAYDCIN